MTIRVFCLSLVVFLRLAGEPSLARASSAHPPQLPPAVQEEEKAQEEGAQDDTWRGPLANRNQFPPAFLFISLEPERARVLQKGERSVLLHFDYSNILILQENESESLQIDLETLRTLLQGKFGLGRGLEISGSLPMYWMQGGFLDAFISGFHKALNLPNRVRDIEPNNVFRYHWRVEDRPVLEREDGFVAVGDLTLQMKRAFIWNELGGTELAARAAIKLPTGSRDRLVSSGRTDLGFGVELSRVGRKIGGYFNLSYHITSHLEEVRSKDFFSWMAALDWRFKPRLSTVLQYDEFRPILESDLGVLKQSGRQIVFGLRWRRSNRFHFEWRFAEDITTTTPDFTLGFQVTYNWKRTEAESEPSKTP